MEHLDLYNIL